MPKKLFQEERHRLILSTLDDHGRISVDDLSRTLGISQVTIRNDLQYLASKRLLVRTHGGAIQASDPGSDLSFDVRLNEHSPEKRAIGRAAGKMVADGDVIALDASTTTLSISMFLRTQRDLTVVTNGYAIVNDLLPLAGVTVMLLGGFLRRDALTFFGLDHAELLKNLHIDKAFISARGLAIESGLTELSEQEGLMKREMIQAARHTVALIDSSKIGVASLHSFAGIECIQTLITDSGVTPEAVAAIEEKGVEVIIAQ